MMSNYSGDKCIKRWRSLDALRGIAVLLVLFRHLEHFGLQAPREDSSYIQKGLYFISAGGWVGVDLFFVLSGYLVTGILFRQFQTQGRIRPIQFLIRRGMKIYPAFWIFAATSLTWLIFTDRPFQIRAVIIDLLFLQSYFPGNWWHTWSLAAEEHFYLGICSLMVVMYSISSNQLNPFRLFPWLCAVTALSILWLRVNNPLAFTHENFFYFFAPSHLRCDAFLTGALLAYYNAFYCKKITELCTRWRTLWFALGFTLLLPAFFLKIETERIVTTWLFTSNAIGCGVLLMAALGTRLTGHPLDWAICAVGESSYSIYLWHIFFWQEIGSKAAVWWQVPRILPLMVVIYLLTTIIWGMAMGALIERPALKLRDYLFPDRSQA